MLDRATAIKIVIPFLRARESFRSAAYQDGAGVWTIGYGHTAGVKPGMKISFAEGEQLLEQDAEQIAGLIETHMPTWLNPNQFAALISFAFNVGPGKYEEKDGLLTLKNGKPSHLLRYLRAPSAELAPTQIGDEFLHWIYIAGEPSSGLCSRRTMERKLFLTPYTPPGVTPELADDSSSSGVKS